MQTKPKTILSIIFLLIAGYILIDYFTFQSKRESDDKRLQALYQQYPDRPRADVCTKDTTPYEIMRGVILDDPRLIQTYTSGYALNFGCANSRGSTTPLSMAVQWERKEAFKALLDLGLPLSGETLLVSVNKDPFYVMEYINRGGDVNAKKDGATAPYSVSDNYLETYKILIDKGMNVNVNKEITGTPLDLALELKQQKMVAYLKSIGAKTAVELGYPKPKQLDN